MLKIYKNMIMRKQNIIKGSLLLVTVFIVQSCFVAKDYEKPQVNTDNLYRTEQVADSSSLASMSWDKMFTDEKLQSYINEAIQNNLDMKIALQNMAAAEATMKQGNAGYFPTLNGNATWTHQEISQNSQFGRLFSSIDQYEMSAKLIHGHVAAADHAHLVAAHDRRVVLGETIGLHQIAPRQVLVGRVDPAEVLAANAQELRQTGPHADEHRVVTRSPSSSSIVSSGRRSGSARASRPAAQVVDLLLDDRLGQPELGNAVHQHAARPVEGLEDRHLVAQQDQVAGHGQARRARSRSRPPCARWPAAAAGSSIRPFSRS